MKMPSPGESITEVEIANWMVADGNYVERDQLICEIDSDKATLELNAEESGKIRAEHGNWTIRVQLVGWRGASRVVFGFPHFSRYKIEGRTNVLEAIAHRLNQATP